MTSAHWRFSRVFVHPNGNARSPFPTAGIGKFAPSGLKVTAPADSTAGGPQTFSPMVGARDSCGAAHQSQACAQPGVIAAHAHRNIVDHRPGGYIKLRGAAAAAGAPHACPEHNCDNETDKYRDDQREPGQRHDHLGARAGSVQLTKRQIHAVFVAARAQRNRSSARIAPHRNSRMPGTHMKTPPSC
jgi:hypothetical protein